MLRKVILALLVSIFHTTILSAQITIQGQTQPCQGSMETYSLQASPTCNTYLWSISGGTIIGSAGGTSVTVWWNGVAGSQGSVSAVGTKCGANEISLFSPVTYVTIYAAPPAPIISGSFDVECNYTGPLTYSASTVTDATEYVWSLPPGWSGQTSGQSITVFPNALGGGTLSVYAKVKCAQSTSLSSVNIGRSAPTLGAISGGAGCFCAGQTQTFSVPAVNGATSYQWSASGSLTIMGGQGTTSVSIGTNGSGGTLSCTAVTPCGNTNTVNSNYINTASAPPPTPSVTVVTTPCANYVRTGLLSITNFDPCATYYWSASPDSHVISGAGSLAVVAVPGFGYEAQVYGMNACGTSGVGTRTIPVDPGCFGPLRVAPLSISAAPNPLSDRTTLSYSLPEEGQVQIEVHSPTGRRITTLVNTRREAGSYEVVFDASRLPVGVYVATLSFKAKGEKHQTTSVQLSVSR